MMQSISRTTTGSARYHARYHGDGGLAIGGGAEALGLIDLPDSRTIHERLLRGFDPAGSRKLVQNAGDPDRVAGLDLVSSAPKSVSVAWGVGSASVRKAIELAHEA